MLMMWYLHDWQLSGLYCEYEITTTMLHNRMTIRTICVKPDSVDEGVCNAENEFVQPQLIKHAAIEKLIIFTSWSVAVHSKRRHHQTTKQEKPLEHRRTICRTNHVMKHCSPPSKQMHTMQNDVHNTIVQLAAYANNDWWWCSVSANRCDLQRETELRHKAHRK